MSRPDSTDARRTMMVQKPKSNIYTALLGVAAMALLFACLLMVIEINRFAGDVGWFGAIKGPSL